MAIKYFNIKIGSRKVGGAVIKVDTSENKNKRLEDLTNFETNFQPEFKFLEQTNEGEIYEAIFKNFKYNLEKSLFLHTGYAITEETGEPNKHIKILVTDKGNLNFRIPLVCDGWLDVSWNSDSDQKPLEEWHLHATGL